MDKAQRRQLSIGGPLVLPDRGSWSDEALDDWNRQCGIPLLTELDVALLGARIIDAEHPALFGTQLVTLVVFRLYHDAIIDLQDLPWPTERRWRIDQLPGTNVSEVLVPLYSNTRRDPGHAENHLDGFLMCPLEVQPDEFLDALLIHAGGRLAFPR